MVVDDEADMRGVLSLFLKRSGHQVEEASSGEEMLAKLNTYKPDLVLLDMRMAGIDGLRTLQKIREMDKKLPVIMVSGYGGQRFRRTSRAKRRHAVHQQAVQKRRAV